MDARLAEIRGAVAQVTETVAEIASAAREQATGIDQVARAVGSFQLEGLEAAPLHAAARPKAPAVRGAAPLPGSGARRLLTAGRRGDVLDVRERPWTA